MLAWQVMAESAEIDPRVQAAADGDRGAVHELLTELLPRVRNLIRYLLRGDGEVDDMAQEALIAIARGLPGYRGEGKLTSWSDRIVVRTVFAELRRDRKHHAERDVGADLSLVSHPGSPPDRYAERRGRVELLDRLPEDQRRALVLHHVVGFSVAEVARELDVPLETVRSRLRLGKARFRALHQTESEGGGV
jgi:RNA polymerase sigma-70 factor (ECF subfamily)